MNEVTFEEIRVGSYFFIDEKVAKVYYHTSDQNNPQLSVGYKFQHEIGTLPVNVFWTSLQKQVQGIIITDEFLKALGFEAQGDKSWLHGEHEQVQFTAAGIEKLGYVHLLQQMVMLQHNIVLKMDLRRLMD